MYKQEDYLRKGNQLTEDQPVVNHLRIGGQGKFLHDADEDGRHHQHVGQVHRKSYVISFVSLNPSAIAS